MKSLSQLPAFLRDVASQFRQRLDLQYLFIIAVVLRLLYMTFMLGQISPADVMQLTPDSMRYIGLGKELLNWRIMDETAVLIFGPGYGAFLGAVFFIFGISAIAAILTQIILSSLSCLMIYRLGNELTGSRAVGLIAGYLSAVSFTSISLANILLSDTLFFFLFLSGSLLFWLGLKQKRRGYAILSGLAIGLAILTRSIGQFWPIVMVALIFILPADNRGEWWKKRLARLKVLWLAPAIAIAIVSIWVARNYHHHDTIMLAATSIGGPANVAAFAAAELENTTVEQIRVDWEKEFGKDSADDYLDLVSTNEVYRKAVLSSISRYPAKMMEMYIRFVYENVTAINELYRQQCPAYLLPIMDIMYWYRGHDFHHISFWGGMAGLILCTIRRKWMALIVLGLIFFYFTFFMGFARDQGSRLFFPAQIAWAILMAYVIISILDGLRRLVSTENKKTRPIESAGPQ